MTEPIIKKVLVVEEKYGNSYYDASTTELISRAAVSILKERKEAGYWYHREYDQEQHFSEEEKQLLSVTDEELEATPEVVRGDLTKKVLRLRDSVKSYARRKKMEEAWFAALDLVTDASDEEAWKIIDNGQGGNLGRPGTTSLAYRLLYSRTDYQYEGFSIENIETV